MKNTIHDRMDTRCRGPTRSIFGDPAPDPYEAHTHTHFPGIGEIVGDRRHRGLFAVSRCDPEPNPEIVPATFTAGNPSIEENAPPIAHGAESLSGWHLPTCICHTRLVRYTINRSCIGSFRLSIPADRTIAWIALSHALPVLCDQRTTCDARQGCLTCPGS